MLGHTWNLQRQADQLEGTAQPHQGGDHLRTVTKAVAKAVGRAVGAVGDVLHRCGTTCPGNATYGRISLIRST